MDCMKITANKINAGDLNYRSEQFRLRKKSATQVQSKGIKLRHISLNKTTNSKSFSNLIPCLVLGKQIGNGKSSAVFASTLGSHHYAVKVVEKKYKKYAKNEAEALQKLSSEYIVKFYKKYEKPENTWLVLEFVHGQDLFSFMQKTHLSPSFISNLSKQLVQALQTIHSSGFIYRDLKPENVMIQEDGKIKLIDFGLAKAIKAERTNTICGSAQYMAPEVIKGEFYDYSADFWSLGALIFECFVGRPPFSGSSFNEISENVISGEIELNLIHHIWGRDFIRRLLNRDATLRLGQMNAKTSCIWSHRFLNL